MIVTVTPNPSLDKTVELADALITGAVQRAVRATAEPGGKGVNISRALCAADRETLALLPGDPSDPVLTGLTEAGVPHRSVSAGAPLRTNITVTDPRGVTTKINEPGPTFGDAGTRALIELTAALSGGASWVALAGSLPPGMPEDLYARVITELRDALLSAAPKVALDSSGAALAAAVAASPDLIKPNAEELLELVTRLTGAAPDISPEALEAEPEQVLDLARRAQSCGARTVLVTLGAHGALLVPPRDQQGHGVLRATGPTLVARSTVGAGDASLAGYLLADESGSTAEEALRRAAAQGRAAASLPGSVMPRPEDLNLEAVDVTAFAPRRSVCAGHPHPTRERTVRTP
ncbi:MAG: 1-phosphofructokinase family hexose kinase [Nesterenkonia sp.]|uniref:1-phosphofructokinase family hexose kinase n=1 Tax=Nesterenkonia marinintestina TaxID=2979865 RepID=UPI0021BE32D6|nr:1-phosphofructokinase family hexose kinase [Nesterenkonia sp. GX14115]MDO5492814.1 1-phosphofructokinase family hexose kinase [Nesterenkonia sp.]